MKQSDKTPFFEKEAGDFIFKPPQKIIVYRMSNMQREPSPIKKALRSGLPKVLPALLLFFFLSNSAIAASTNDLPNLINKIRKGVATILVYGENGKKPLRQGTGFLVSKDGHLVTNRHVVERARHGKVVIEGKEYSVNKILSVDTLNDLVKLKIESENSFTPLPLSTRIPLVGERIVVIGSPMGLEQTVSEGIISAVRDIPGLGVVYQLTAPISSGSSGSPVVSLKGEVIGIATFQVIQGQNLNFAIPSTRIIALQSIKEQLLVEWTTGLSKEQIKEAFNHYIEGAPDEITGNCKAALQNYERAVAIDSKTARYWEAIGRCSFKTERPERAIEAFKKAINLGIEEGEIYRYLGRAYLSVNNFEGALEALKLAVQLEPSNSNGYKYLGMAFNKAGFVKDSIDAYTKSIAIDAKDNTTYLLIAFVFIENKQYPTAEKYLMRGLEINSKDLELRETLIHLYIQMRKNNAASDQYRLLKDLSPERAEKFDRMFKALNIK